MPKPRCAHEECLTIPVFGIRGQHSKGQWCRKHAPEGAVDLHKQLCAHHDCGKHPSFGVRGQHTTRRWCRSHAPEGAEDVRNKRCNAHGCDKINPLFGKRGVDKRGRWCREHAPEGTVDLHTMRCEAPGCDKINPVFGVAGVDKRGRWCSKHAPQGAEDIMHRRCEADGCRILNPVFGVPSVDKRGRWCRTHAPEGARDVVTKPCMEPGCDTQPAYGVCGVDKGPRWCRIHAPSAAEDMRNRKCEYPGCDVQRRQPFKFCANHDTRNTRRTRVRENQVANFLRERGLLWTSWNKQVSETSCGVYRPDLVFDRPTHVTIVEVDEHQHAQPGYACDDRRMLDVWNAYGGMPVVFIRWNPDAFAMGGKPARCSMPGRLEALERQLRARLAAPPDHLLTIVRMFYDQPNDKTVVATHVRPDDASFVEHPIVTTPS